MKPEDGTGPQGGAATRADFPKNTLEPCLCRPRLRGRVAVRGYGASPEPSLTAEPLSDSTPPPGSRTREPATPRRFYCSRRASDPAEEREPLTPMEARGLLTVNGASGDYGSLPGGEQEGPPGSGRRRSHAFAGQPCGVERGTGECLCLSPCLNVCLYTSLLMTLCPCFSLVGGKSQWFDSKSPPL